ncbi:hypothetical protein COCNU_09G004080 [Cocos nucifera]|uniref:Transducin/WD40 repeat-like superfamily protein n=1 Tax=Cocos nucifera TaxID=13894 RepID=A0A8K0N749_COCNU|nr:hypothetical protein COCNU_09G004080 [Cocos nucifera]
MMGWTTVQHLDLRHVGRGLKPLQPHATSFHPTQAIVAVAIGTYIIEFDALSGSKISSIDIGSRVVRMSYSPTSGHAVIAILEDCTVRSCNFDTEQTLVLHSPEKRSEQISADTEVHLALTPLQPVVFFGFHKRMSVTVVGTVEGGRPPTKIKTDLKKPIVNLACHPRLPVLYVAYADGLIRAYNIQTYAVHYTLQLDNTIKLIGAGAFAFHPTLEWIFVGDRRGTLLAWDVSTQQPNLIGICCLEGKAVSFRFIRNFGRSSTPDTAARTSLEGHFMEGHAKSGPISRLPLITISDVNHQLQDVPVCQEGSKSHLPEGLTSFILQPFHLELNFFNKENRVLHYPVRAFYLDGLHLMAYNISSGADNLYKKLYSAIPANVECLPKSILYSSKKHFFLVVFELSGASGVLHEVVLYWEQTDQQSVNNKGNSIKGRDAALMGPNENQYAILDEDKTGLSLYILPGMASQEASGSNGALDAKSFADTGVVSNQGPLQFIFETEVDHIFSSPLESSILYVISGNHIGLAKLLQGYRLSADDGRHISTKTDGKKFIKLKPNETVFQVRWQETLRGHVAGIVTSHRVLIASADLDILSSSSSKFDKGLPSISFSTLVHSLVLVGALNDRLLLANPTEINPRQKKGVEIRSCLVGLLEPLLIGFATMQQHFEQKLDLSEVLYQITSRFDSLRITPRSLDILAKGSPVCGDLAVSLSQAGPQFTQVLRCTYAIKALRFSTALSVLKDEFLRSRDYPQCPPTSQLFHRFRQLGYACIKYGQFDSAKETFEVIGDYESMLDLFICHLNPSAMRRLAQKLEEAATDSELRRYCERILRIRSTGWTQGIFANFAAESMVPKGPEWGGGNWEIKTPINMKDIPQWELAGEVMPYMKTSEGPIPSVIADHIGVYLGAVRGRGNVVEVSEKSLVKAFTAASGENKSLTSSELLPKQIKDGDSKGDSIVDSLTKQLAGPASAGDEQAKAAEEFKRSLYGVVDGGSSDEDETTSKTKKIQIRIRDKPAAPAVDVDKLKAATKQLGLGPSMRTRSLSGPPQDFSMKAPQTAPVTTASAPATATDMFGTDALSAQSPSQSSSMVAGMGVSAGPIPEDFFQNTISSLQIAASLPPPGTYLSRADQHAQVKMENNSVSNQNVMTDIGLPDGGVPPQAPQQPQVPQQPQLEATGLPQIGVPPQSQALPPRIPVSSQPIDLSSLEVPGSNATKSPPTAPSGPTAVRPGQVPRGAPASVCFKTGLAHLEQNQLPDALSCLDEAFLALAKDQSRGADIKAQATICAQYKIAVALLQEIARLQKVQGPGVLSAKEEMARLSRHLASLPLQAKHRINCIRTAIKRNMEVQNYAYAKQMLDLLLSKAPPGKQDELRSLIDMCVQRGLSNKSIDPFEDPSQFCAATLSRLSTIGHDICDLCGAKFSALSTPGCIICGMGSIKRSDALAGPVPSPFG